MVRRAGVTVLGAGPGHERRYLTELGQTLAPSSLAHHQTVLGRFYRYAVASGHLDLDPMSGVPRVRVRRISRGTWLDRGELVDLLTQADEDPAPAVPALIWALAVHGCCLVTGLLEALDPEEDESHGSTEEVPR
jgi:site-specific recombinase XerC